jgi:hypothetical protein
MKKAINIEEILPYIISYLDRVVFWEKEIALLDKDNDNDKEIYREYINEEMIKVDMLLYLITNLCYDMKGETIIYKGVEVHKQLYLDYISYFTPKILKNEKY